MERACSCSCSSIGVVDVEVDCSMTNLEEGKKGREEKRKDIYRLTVENGKNKKTKIELALFLALAVAAVYTSM